MMKMEMQEKKFHFFPIFFLFATWHIFFVAVTVVEWNKKNSRIQKARERGRQRGNKTGQIFDFDINITIMMMMGRKSGLKSGTRKKILKRNETENDKSVKIRESKQSQCKQFIMKAHT